MSIALYRIDDRLIHGQDFVLKDLEQDAQRQAGPDVAQHRAGDRPGYERPRDHHLGHAHQIEADQSTPGEQPQEELQAHVKSSRGTGAAVGTSCAVTTMPRAASALSCAASASLK